MNNHSGQQCRITPESLGFPSKIGDLIIEPVSWKNFPAKRPESTWFLAYTYWTNNYRAQCVGVKDKATRCWATFATSISPKSWRDPESQTRELLKHEYGHYLINCVMGLDFRLTANTYGLSCQNFAEFKKYCETLFSQKRKQYAQKQKQYDKDSYHYLDRAGQEKWEKWMKEQILSFAKKQKQYEADVKTKTIKLEKIRNRPNLNDKKVIPNNNSNNIAVNRKAFSLRKVQKNKAVERNMSGVKPNNSKKPLNVMKMIETQYAKQEF